jgi:hypothetical protein
MPAYLFRYFLAVDLANAVLADDVRLAADILLHASRVALFERHRARMAHLTRSIPA